MLGARGSLTTLPRGRLTTGPGCARLAPASETARIANRPDGVSVGPIAVSETWNAQGEGACFAVGFLHTPPDNTNPEAFS